MSLLTPLQKKHLSNKKWRMSNLYKIRNKDGVLVVFKPNRAQLDFEEHRTLRNLIVKSRQLGFTTLEAIDILDDCLFTRNYNGLFIAQDLDTAKDIFSNKIELAWNQFALSALYKVNTDTARQIKFDFGDKTLSTFTVDSSGRSGTFNRLHISEFDLVCRKYPDKAREILEGSIPAIPLGGRVDIETTVKGSEGRFYDMVMSSMENSNPTPMDWKVHFYNWQWDDAELSKIKEDDISVFKVSVDYSLFRDYQIQHKLNDREITYYYFKWISLSKDWASMKSEYPTTIWEAFEGSGNKMFDSDKLNKMELKVGERVGDWIYYEKPIIGHNYRAGCDVAEGVGQDSSTVVIWDFTPLKPKIVAEYANNKIAPDLFAYEIKNGCSLYGMAMAGVERNNHGHTTISKLKEIYPERYIYKDIKEKYGWDTNLITKPKMMFDLNTAVNNELVDIPSLRIVNEMRRYDKEDLSSARFDSQSTQHFDLIIASAIGLQMKDVNQIAGVNFSSFGNKAVFK